MSLKTFFIQTLAYHYHLQMQRWSMQPIENQKSTFRELIRTGKNTTFGKDFHFDRIYDYEDFKREVPLTDYEGLKPYIERVKQGEKDVLWKGKPLYFAKTSGTTSGVKYIPISRESMQNQIAGGRASLMSYIANSKDAKIFNGKMIFLQGSPELHEENGINIGRLSGIVAHHIPKYALKNRLPSWETNCVENWEEKIDKICEETLPESMSVISGIPPWMQNYFELLLQKTGKKNVAEIFPNLSLLVTGGVNFEPYKARFDELLGKKIPNIETYPASEGFIAYQDTLEPEGLLLCVNGGIFYEFIPLEEFHKEYPTRLALEEIELHKDYAIVLNTNAGLWGYVIGDTVQFVSKNPYRIKVSGRVKHFISAFGEHVIGNEVEHAMKIALEETGGQINEFTVAPQVNPTEGLPYHEWLVEFEKLPADLAQFSEIIDNELQKKNVYYYDLIQSKMLRPAVVTIIPKNGFNEYMKSVGKLGGQNKVPRLANDRNIADALHQLLEDKLD